MTLNFNTGALNITNKLGSEPTGETVNILIYSDNPKTPWKDGYTEGVLVKSTDGANTFKPVETSDCK